MTVKSVLSALVMSLLCSHGLAGTLPGQDISAYASVSYSSQIELSSYAEVSYTDPLSSTQQSQSVPSTVVVETSASPVSAGPATSFVAPDPGAPVYFTTTNSFYSGPSLVGKYVKVAGTVRMVNGVAYIDDGAVITVSDSSGQSTVPAGIAVRADLLTSIPVNGSLAIVKGVVRLESDGQPSLLPIDDSAITQVQQ